MAGWTGLWRPNAQVYQLLSSRFHRLLLSGRQHFFQEVLKGVPDVPLEEARTQELSGSHGEHCSTKKLPGTVQKTMSCIVRIISTRPTLGISLHC